MTSRGKAPSLKQALARAATPQHDDKSGMIQRTLTEMFPDADKEAIQELERAIQAQVTKYNLKSTAGRHEVSE
jgi:hypothetical protein